MDEDPPTPYDPEIEELKRLRSALAPESTFKVLDDYGKWLVASAALLSSLATGFGVAGFGDLHELGKIVFVGAILLMATSLALAIVSLRPSRLSYNPNSIEDMTAVIDGATRSRARFLQVAGVAFAISLILAALAHPLSAEPREPSGITFTLADDGAMTARIVVHDAEPSSFVRARLVSKGVPRGVFMPRVRTFAGENGTATAAITLKRTAGFQTVTIVRDWLRKGNTARTVERLRIAIPHRNRPPPEPAARPNPPREAG